MKNGGQQGPSSCYCLIDTTALYLIYLEQQGSVEINPRNQALKREAGMELDSLATCPVHVTLLILLFSGY